MSLRTPENVRRAVVLRQNGHSYESIGRAIGCGKNTVPYLLQIAEGSRAIKSSPIEGDEAKPHVQELQRLTAYWLTRPMGAQ